MFELFFEPHAHAQRNRVDDGRCALATLDDALAFEGRQRVPDLLAGGVEPLAELTGMSVASFYRHFKAITAMTPIQYQKRLRLLKARRLLLFEPRDAAAIGFSVGYESASQFSREYARMFGLPPVRDMARLKMPASAEPVSAKARFRKVAELT